MENEREDPMMDNEQAEDMHPGERAEGPDPGADAADAADAAQRRHNNLSANVVPLRYVAVICFALSCACFHSTHVSNLFENDRHFSHLSTLEREMCFRTEMGLYYSYFKRIAESPNILIGFKSILMDNVTEYPDKVNLFHRFNLAPEAFMGILYHMYTGIMETLNIPSKQCFIVERGGGKPAVRSCEGMGEPVFFYLEGVWFCAGLSAFMLFVYGFFISDSIAGGTLTILCFFFNHAECTRVQWTPPLRESFAYPFVLTHCLAVSIVLDGRKVTSRFTKIALVGGTAYFMLFLWQFSQFILTCEVGIFLIMFYSGSINWNTLLDLVISLTVSEMFALTGLLANELLMTSFLSVTLVVAWLNVLLHNQTVWHRISSCTFLSVTLSGLLCVVLKQNMPGQDDAHIINIFLSKILTVKEDFHTLMYTCSPEFRGLPWSSVVGLFKSLLIPLVIAALFCLALLWLRRLAYFTDVFARFRRIFTPPEELYDPCVALPRPGYGVPMHSVMKLIEPGLVFNIGLLCAFAMMSAMIMRLKLLLTPHLCMLVSLLGSEKIMSPLMREKTHFALLTMIVAAMSIPGFHNVVQQLSIRGEYSNYPLEELILWVKENTPSDAVFAGPMPTMANLLLSTGRPIVNHPHYENTKLRERTKKVYSLFSRKPADEVHEELEQMGVDYAVLEQSTCLDYRRPVTGCRMTDLWDVDDPDNRDQPPLCPQLFYNNPGPFHRVYSNSEYVVLAVKLKSVELPTNVMSAAL